MGEPRGQVDGACLKRADEKEKMKRGAIRRWRPFFYFSLPARDDQSCAAYVLLKLLRSLVTVNAPFCCALTLML
jgi:hypothetical protein